MLLDTSGLLCYLHKEELQHPQAVEHLHSAPIPHLTHSYVLSELIALATVRRFPRPAILSFVTALLDTPDIQTVWVTEPLHRAALDLLSQRLDKTYSLCDAVSCVLMRQHNILEALTTDRHFEQEGFIRLLP